MNQNIYARQWDVNSFTSPRKTAYKVSERHDGGWECSCPAWTMHTPRKDCKHIVNVRGASGRSPQLPVFIPVEPVVTPVQDEQQPEIVSGGYTIRRRRVLQETFGGNGSVAATHGRGGRKL